MSSDDDVAGDSAVGNPNPSPESLAAASEQSAAKKAAASRVDEAVAVVAENIVAHVPAGGTGRVAPHGTAKRPAATPPQQAVITIDD